jgi:simple sugar transport system ATP-binding protein
VLRAGKVTGEVDPTRETNASLSRLMIGSEPPQLKHERAHVGAVALELKGLTLAKQSPFGTDLKDIALSVRAGEIVGVAGVSGNGQQEFMAALSGEDPRAPAGSVRLFGADIAHASPRRRRKLGLHFVPEERLGRGAVPTLSLAQNTLLTRTEAVSGAGWIDVKQVERLAAELIRRFNVKAGGPDAAAKSLSGGNLQKFLVGREIDARPKLLIVSQPTWGVDVGAAAQIRGELLALRDAGCALLVVSEELDELFEIADRLVVIAQGRLSPSIGAAQATIEMIGEWMSGLWPQPGGPLPGPLDAGENGMRPRSSGERDGARGDSAAQGSHHAQA